MVRQGVSTGTAFEHLYGRNGRKKKSGDSSICFIFSDTPAELHYAYTVRARVVQVDLRYETGDRETEIKKIAAKHRVLAFLVLSSQIKDVEARWGRVSVTERGEAESMPRTHLHDHVNANASRPSFFLSSPASFCMLGRYR